MSEQEIEFYLLYKRVRHYITLWQKIQTSKKEVTSSTHIH